MVEYVFVKGGKAMQVSQEKLDGRHRVLLWIYKQGDAKDSAELVWVLQRVVDELERLNQGSQGKKRLRSLFGTVMH